MLRFRLLSTRWGWFTLVMRDARLVRTVLPTRDESTCLGMLREQFPDADHDDRLAPDLCAAVRDHFSGKRVRFRAVLDFDGLTAFQAAVIRACRRIPPGRTCSYGELAERAGFPHAARAVGGVMARNRHPLIVPCHRVIASDGSAGGWSATGGLEQKRALLRLEGLHIE